MRVGLLMMVPPGEPTFAYIRPALIDWLESAGLTVVPISPAVSGAEAAAYFEYIHGLVLCGAGQAVCDDGYRREPGRRLFPHMGDLPRVSVSGVGLWRNSGVHECARFACDGAALNPFAEHGIAASLVLAATRLCAGLQSPTRNLFAAVHAFQAPKTDVPDTHYFS